MGLMHRIITYGNVHTYQFFMQTGTVFTVVPQYWRPAQCTNNNMCRLFEENNITNPILIGDLNARIGEITQELNEVYQELFVAGLETRKSKDRHINKKGNQIIELCTNNNLLILNGRRRRRGRKSYVR